MNTKHTPGRWMVVDEPNPADDGTNDVGPVTSMVVTHDAHICGGIVEDHDAFLIAAAPEMLNALQRCLRYGGLYPDLAEEVRALIAKATGVEA